MLIEPDLVPVIPQQHDKQTGYDSRRNGFVPLASKYRRAVLVQLSRLIQQWNKPWIGF